MAGEPDPAVTAAIQAALLAWYDAHRRDLPWRDIGDPYRVLVSETMLQQTQVDRVIPKYHAFLERFPTLASLAEASPAEVIRAWEGLGYNMRALRLHGIARAAVDRYGGELPRDVDALRALPGIGPYTAAAVACFAFGAQVATVDTNIRRVLARVLDGHDPDGTTAEARHIWDSAGAILPSGRAGDWNQALMDLGATICTARAPRHLVCPLRDQCRYVAAGAAPLLRVAESPAEYRTKGRPARPKEQFVGSSRYYRGRIVDRLRALPPGVSLPLDELGAAVKPDYGPADSAWLREALDRLARDGLVVLEDGPAGITVRLPH